MTTEPIEPTEQDPLAQLESDWAFWLIALFPSYVTAPFAPHHIEFWEWAWAIETNKRPRPWIGVWPRGGGKSWSAASAVISLGARGLRKYCAYVCESQEQADKHLADDIAPMLESPELSVWYPSLSEAALTKYGHRRGWRRNRIHTASGFVIDALGLDVASRGMRVEEFRPDIIVFDDLDTDTDTEAIVDRKMSTLTRRILPAAASHVAVIGIQNLIHSDSVFSRLVDGRAEFLADRIVSGPIPAIRDLVYETQTIQGRPRTVITGGTAAWEGQSLHACQEELDTIGITSFLSELQHETPDPTGGMYDHVTFRHCKPGEVPPLDKIVCWVDPAVTDTDESDSQAIQIDGIARDRILYRLWSWEKRTSPETALRMAFTQALQYGAIYVGVETDQGGDTWRIAARAIRDELGPEYSHIQFRDAKAGQGHGSKVHRSSQMLADYERGQIIHVEGTHHILERALIRFPRTKPFDLADAAYWGFWDLRRLSRPAKALSAARTPHPTAIRPRLQIYRP